MILRYVVISTIFFMLILETNSLPLLDLSDIEIDAKLYTGIDALISGDFYKGIEIFENLEKIIPEMPTGYFFHAFAYALMIREYRIEDKTILSKFTNINNLAYNKAQKYNKKNLDEEWAKFYLAGSSVLSRVFPSTANEKLRLISAIYAERSVDENLLVYKIPDMVYFKYYWYNKFTDNQSNIPPVFMLRKYVSMLSIKDCRYLGFFIKLLRIDILCLLKKYNDALTELTALTTKYGDSIFISNRKLIIYKGLKMYEALSQITNKLLSAYPFCSYRNVFYLNKLLYFNGIAIRFYDQEAAKKIFNELASNYGSKIFFNYVKESKKIIFEMQENTITNNKN